MKEQLKKIIFILLQGQARFVDLHCLGGRKAHPEVQQNFKDLACAEAVIWSLHLVPMVKSDL